MRLNGEAFAQIIKVTRSVLRRSSESIPGRFPRLFQVSRRTSNRGLFQHRPDGKAGTKSGRHVNGRWAKRQSPEHTNGRQTETASSSAGVRLNVSSESGGTWTSMRIGGMLFIGGISIL